MKFGEFRVGEYFCSRLTKADLLEMYTDREGDVIGCVASLADRSSNVRRDHAAGAIDTEAKLIQAAAGFLGRHTEA